MVQAQARNCGVGWVERIITGRVTVDLVDDHRPRDSGSSR